MGKESTDDRAIKKHVLEESTGEGKASFELAPIAKLPAGLPPAWKAALGSDRPTNAVLDLVWKPLAKIQPKTIAAMRKKLQRVGLLTTAKGSHSIIYVFELEDGGGLWTRRGHLPAKKLPAVAKRLPKDFLAIYAVHDGWLDGGQMMGPRRAEHWGPLGSEGPSRDFLVTFEGHGPGSLGFDLSERTTPCFIVWTSDEPERVKNVTKEIDEWIAGRMDEYEPVPKSAPKKAGAAAPKKKGR